MMAITGAASSMAGISKAIRSVGTIPSAPSGFSSITPRPLARQRSVHESGLPASKANSGTSFWPSAPAIDTERSIHAERAEVSLGGSVVPRIVSCMVIVEPASTGGDTVARRSVPLPRSTVRASTDPCA